jgi:hypothetical protein
MKKAVISAAVGVVLIAVSYGIAYTSPDILEQGGLNAWHFIVSTVAMFMGIGLCIYSIHKFTRLP